MREPTVRFDVLTLHPDLVEGPLGASIIGRAREQGLIEARAVQLRQWGVGRYKQVDDTPYGGGGGMVIRVDVVDRALQELRGDKTRVLLMDPAGVRFGQRHARRLAQCAHLVFVCGHYEGIDGRVRDHLVDEVFSIGDYVLTGGELPALVIIDAVARLIPGVLGNPTSNQSESHEQGVLEAPHYTRPKEYRGWGVPEVLQGGNHKKIDLWRKEAGMALTRRVRPDLLGADEE